VRAIIPSEVRERGWPANSLRKRSSGEAEAWRWRTRPEARRNSGPEVQLVTQIIKMPFLREKERAALRAILWAAEELASVVMVRMKA
jgi:hypothetical protein